MTGHEMEIKPERQAIDGLLIALSGGVIGIIGAIVEMDILSSPNLNLRSAILMGGGATLIGVGLAFKGAVNYIDVRRVLRKKGRE